MPDKAPRTAAALFIGTLPTLRAELACHEFESLSLRQLGRSRLFSAQLCRQFTPVLAAISDLSSGLLNRQSQLVLLQMAHFSLELWTRGFGTVLQTRVFREAYERQQNGIL